MFPTTQTKDANYDRKTMRNVYIGDVQGVHEDLSVTSGSEGDCDRDGFAGSSDDDRDSARVSLKRSDLGTTQRLWSTCVEHAARRLT